MNLRTLISLSAAALLLMFVAAPVLAETAPAAPASLWGPALRMLASLIAVLAIVAALAWVAQRLKNGGRLQSGLIQVVSGVSLGNREKVVLLRVNDEDILVGVGPAGMRSLHVMRSRNPQPSFADVMEDAE